MYTGEGTGNSSVVFVNNVKQKIFTLQPVFIRIYHIIALKSSPKKFSKERINAII